jgi:hypothetical protein
MAGGKKKQKKSRHIQQMAMTVWPLSNEITLKYTYSF